MMEASDLTMLCEQFCNMLFWALLDLELFCFVNF